MDCTYRPNDVVPIIGKKLLIVSKKIVCFCVGGHYVVEYNHIEMMCPRDDTFSGSFYMNIN